MKLRRLSTRASDFATELAALTRYEAAQDPQVQRTVAEIIAAVRARGDAALLDYARRFDRSSAQSVAALEVPLAHAEQALAALAPAPARALRQAPERNRPVHERQVPK
jgi:histidinol dehydrogenase